MLTKIGINAMDTMDVHTVLDIFYLSQSSSHFFGVCPSRIIDVAPKTIAEELNPTPNSFFQLIFFCNKFFAANDFAVNQSKKSTNNHNVNNLLLNLPRVTVGLAIITHNQNRVKLM